MKALVLLFVSCLGLTAAFAEDVIWVEAKLNGRPARLSFDTGSPYLFLFRSGAERLGVELRPRSTWGWYWSRENCAVEFRESSWSERVRVFESPSFVEGESDGVLGWPSVSRQRVMIDALQNQLVFEPDLPGPDSGWTPFPVQTDPPRWWRIFYWKWRILGLEMRDADGKDGFVVFDTGSESGIGLSPSHWRRWKAAHPDQPLTLTSGYNPHLGILIREQAWADDFSLGGLPLSGVVVEEADPLSLRWAGRRHIATFGMAALKRLDVMVDGPKGIAYLRPKQTPAIPYDHNRLGAVFAPRHAKNDEAIAHVVKNSPAAAAGIRDGDVILRVDKYDFTNWRTNDTGLFAFWQWPAGTKLNLRLSRNGKPFETEVMLQDIVVPQTKFVRPP